MIDDMRRSPGFSSILDSWILETEPSELIGEIVPFADSNHWHACQVAVVGESARFENSVQYVGLTLAPEVLKRPEAGAVLHLPGPSHRPLPAFGCL
jgi:hypothetical protein